MSAQYEKRVLGFDAWLQKQGYPSFCKVVMENGLAKLEIIVDAVTGLPRVFAVEAWIEFCIGMMTGDVEKGGCRELRANTELYATALHGRSQAEVQMPLEKKGKFGWGPYKDDPFKLQSIQQYATHLAEGGAAPVARRRCGQPDVRRVGCLCDELRAERAAFCAHGGAAAARVDD